MTHEIKTAVTQQVAEFAANTTLSDLPEDVLMRTRLLLLDGIACGLVGAKLPWAQRAVEALSLIHI